MLSWKYQHLKKVKSLNVLIVLLLCLWLINPLGEKPALSIMEKIDGISVAEREMSDLEKEKPLISDEVKSKVAETLQGFAGGFLRNLGEKAEDIYFYTQSAEMAAGFGISEARFRVSSLGQNPSTHNEIEFSDEPSRTRTQTALAVEFLESNAVMPVAEAPTGAYSNSYRGGNVESWVDCNPYYQKLVYYNIYEQIDLIYEVKDSQLKYEFIVHPGGNVNDIKAHWTGPVALELIQGEGIRVLMQGKNGYPVSDGLVDSSPIGYQSHSRERPISASFKLLEDNTYAFLVPAYDPTEILIIDPVLSPVNHASYSTYMAGSVNDNAKGIAVDSSGNAYVTGYTYSTDFPTVNAYNTTGDGNPSYIDAFVFKFSADGSSLLYSTYVGGSYHDRGWGIAVDNAGNAYVAGDTKSTDFPTVNPYNVTGDGSTSYFDVTVFKLSADGGSLLYSTYVGGTRDDYGEGIAVDTSGNAYVTGSTYSTDFPVVNAYNATGDGSTSYRDAFVLKLSADGSTLYYSTYIAGSRNDFGLDIAVDWARNAYVAGYTQSVDFPTMNAYNATGDGSTLYADIVVFKLSTDGNQLLYSTYVGGSRSDTSRGIAIDGAGNVYVAGTTQSIDFPTMNAYDATGDGDGDAYDIVVFKLSAGGDSLLYSTYVAGSDDDLAMDVAVDSSGNAHVIGHTYSTDFPTVNAVDATGDGSYRDLVVFKLSADGNQLLYSTYFGGTHDEVGFGIAVDSSGNVYVTGDTKSTDFPTPNGYNATGDGNPSYYDVVVFKLSTEGYSLEYSTYVTGTSNDRGQGITVDSWGNVYVTGETQSTDFPTVNAYNATGDGTANYDAFVLKLSADGGTLLYSTYVGGTQHDYGMEIAVDSLGNAYVTGRTASTDFPTTSNAYNETGDGTITFYDAFALKLSPDGSSLLYSTYIAGSHQDYGEGIAVDSSGSAYVTGYTYSTDFPTVNAADATGDGTTSSCDVFVLKLSSDGSSLLYSTYVAGSNDDLGYGIAVNSSGSAYVTGLTRSTDFPTVNAYDATGDGTTKRDAFVFKVAANGQLLFSTYVGGSDHDYAQGIAIDTLGNAYVTGYTNSTDFPTKNAYDAVGDGNGAFYDVFVFKLAADGQNLLYSTYVGGSNDDWGYGIAVDHSGIAYVAGYAKSADFPTVNAYDGTGDGDPILTDVVVFKLSSDGGDLLYSTYVGGSRSERGQGIAVSSSGNAYVTGYTASINFPVEDAYDGTSDGDNAYYDVVVFAIAYHHKPAPPTDLKAALSADQRVILTWNAPVDDGNLPITSYRVYRGNASMFYGSVLFLGETTGEAFIDTTAVPGITHYYAVTAMNSLGESLFSNDINITVAFASGVTSPGAPQSLSATPGDNFVELSWAPPLVDGGTTITSYRVYRGTSSGIYALIGVVTTGMSFNDTTVASGTTYYYVVTAINAIGEGVFSSEVSITATGTPPITTTIPGIPQNLSATPGDNFTVLSWSLPLDDGGLPITSYRVYRGTASGAYLLLGVTNDTQFTDTMVMGGTTYYYVVTAVNEAGESVFSSEVTATPTGAPSPLATVPGAPQNLVATSGVNVVALSWSSPSHDGGAAITIYRVYRGTSSGAYFFLGATTSTSFNDTTAAGATTYHYVVTAVNAVGESVFSLEVSATPTSEPSESSEPPESSITSKSEDGSAPGFLVLLLVLSMLGALKRKRKAS
ncbi:MAG: SBBP repeat-containing protein [Candidatus Thorarchaeota archaeon]